MHLYIRGRAGGSLRSAATQSSGSGSRTCSTLRASFFGFLAGTLLSERADRAGPGDRDGGALLGEPLAALERSVAKIADALRGRAQSATSCSSSGRDSAPSAAAWDEWLGPREPGARVLGGEGRAQTGRSLRSGVARSTSPPSSSAACFGAGRRRRLHKRRPWPWPGRWALAAAIGAPSARAQVDESPFDFERNMRVFVAADVPPPSAQDFPVGDRRAGGLCRVLLRAGGWGLARPVHELPGHAGRRRRRRPGSYRWGAPSSCRAATSRGRSSAPADARRGQRRPLRNRQLLDRGRRAGQRARAVVIARLPFQPPTHPSPRRSRLIRDRGGDPFNELTLPRRVIKFRQGVGRLIRTRPTAGPSRFLDSRVLAKAYGRLFIEGLPQRSFTRLTGGQPHRAIFVLSPEGPRGIVASSR